MNKWHKEKIHMKNYECVPVPIISDAIVATDSFGDGRGIPVLILDTSRRKDIEELIINHETYLQGEVNVQWGRARDKNIIILHLAFLKPIECNVILELDIRKRFGLIDWIIHSQSIYLQAGVPGDRLYNSIDTTKMIVEIPAYDFRDEWEKMCLERLAKHYRKKHKLKVRESKRFAIGVIKEFRRTRRLDEVFK